MSIPQIRKRAPSSQPASKDDPSTPSHRAATTSLLIAYLVVMISAQMINFYHDSLLGAATLTSISVDISNTENKGPQMEDLVWFVPRPDKPRILDWEDDWMIQFKNENYVQSQSLDLVRSKENPYASDGLVCHVPSYVPARVLLSSPQDIPRVIFLSWKTSTLNIEGCMAVKSILNQHPEYELIFMNDTAVDQFVCDNYPIDAPNFGQLRAGAARCDAWRMLAIHRYGGVYFDLDMSATSHLNIPANASAYSGIGGWGHLPDDKDTGIGGGVLEHWALAFVPKHNLVAKTIELIWDNLQNPKNEFLYGEEYMAAATSITVRLSGPSVYQRALRYLVITKSSCKGDDMTTILTSPEEHCNMTAYRQEMGNLVMSNPVPMGLALIEKKLQAAVYWPGSGNDYDGDDYNFFIEPQPQFCRDINQRAAARDQEWEEAIQRNRDEINETDKPDSGDENNKDGSDDQNSGDTGAKDSKDEDKNGDKKDGEPNDGGGEKDERNRDGEDDVDKEQAGDGNTEKGEVKQDDEQLNDKQRAEQKRKKKKDQEQQLKIKDDELRKHDEKIRKEGETGEPNAPKSDENQGKEKKTAETAKKD